MNGIKDTDVLLAIGGTPSLERTDDLEPCTARWSGGALSGGESDGDC